MLMDDFLLIGTLLGLVFSFFPFCIPARSRLRQRRYDHPQFETCSAQFHAVDLRPVALDGRLPAWILVDLSYFLYHFQGVSLTMHPRPESIAIIGAGVAGLCTARQLIAEGFDCTLLERNNELGGVWSDGYLNFGAQVQRELYEFPDWPLPEGTPDYTPGPVIQKYLQALCLRFVPV